jgi:16S rRNA (cytosine1402-N4)-methyltransferase
LNERRPHTPVLLAESLRLLAPRPGSTLVDGTLGAGGHAEALLEAVGPAGRVYGIDRDAVARATAERRLARFGAAFVCLAGRHESLALLLREAGIERVDGLLFDLGVSSMQLDEAERGFSFRADGPLDMRMDRTAQPSAAELVASISEKELGRLLRTRGEERRAAAIARAIVRERERAPLTRTRQLAEIIERVAGPAARAERLHPATRTFQALRIAVNHEIEGLAELIEQATALLVPGGRLAIISYHSLEDRVVKQTFRALASRCTCPPRLPVCACGRQDLLKVLTPRPVRPGEAEIAANPRARSARLRAAERL